MPGAADFDQSTTPDSEALATDARLAAAQELLHANSLSAATAATSRLICSEVLDARVALFWSLKRKVQSPRSLRCAPSSARIWADAQFAHAAQQADGPQQLERLQRHWYSWPLSINVRASAIVQMESAQALSAAQLGLVERALSALARRLDELFQTRHLQREVLRSQRSALLQTSLYAISDMASGELDRTQMLRAMHQIVGALMYAENFFIALHDAARQSLRFIYFADTKDYDWPEPNIEFHEDQLTNSLTMAVIRRGAALIGPSKQILQQLNYKDDGVRGPGSEDWLGVPMIADGIVQGAIVVQSYEKSRRYRESDRALLAYVAQHILTAINRRGAQEQLEAQVTLRTQELALANQRFADTNRELLCEVEERQSGERLQAALFRIAELTSTANSLYEFFAAVHAVIGELLYAKNFFIALLVDDGRQMEFPYAVDEHDSGSFFSRRQLRRGLTEYVLRRGKALLATREQIDQLVAAGEMQTLGSRSVCWLGVPLLQNDCAIGAIVVQSYHSQVIYTPRDQELLTFVAFHIATALQRRQAQDSLKLANLELEARVEELHRAQAELIEIEKMASLGRLVAGVAHEVNTPLGIGVTAISFLRGQLADIRAVLPAIHIANLLEPVEAAAAMAETNLQRAANLVKTFKQVAVDQSTNDIRKVAVREYLEGSLLSLQPVLRNHRHRVVLHCAPEVHLTSRADALHQIIVNLVMNSIAHGYPDNTAGTLTISVVDLGTRLQVRYEDDGVGMDHQVASHMFEPFYTTRRNQGGTGLGMHIVYNLVTQALGGRISYETQTGAGVHFDILIPSVHPPARNA